MADEIEFKFNEDYGTMFTDDPLYDLFDGGHIDPKELLVDPEQVKLVTDAVNVVRQFLDKCFEKGFLDDA